MPVTSMSLRSMRKPSTESLHQCDYLIPHTTSYASDLAELVQVNEQIGSLDSHIHRLTELRDTLRFRARQLQNLCSPVNTLPIEVLSHIFGLVVDPGLGSLHANRRSYTKCISKSLNLSSVSVHFHRAALATSELWNRVSLVITNDTIDDLDGHVSMLQHCVAHSPCINVIVRDELVDMDAGWTYDLLFPIEITSKVKTFSLEYSSGLKHWTEKLTARSFPILDTLLLMGLKSGTSININLDLRTLTSVTKLSLYGVYPDGPPILPPAVQVLYLDEMPHDLLAPCLHQCPNLVECKGNPSHGYHVQIESPTPVILNVIKRLYWFVDQASSASSIQSFKLPSLEFLELCYYDWSDMQSAHLLCRDVSTTLTTLIFKMPCYHWKGNNLRQSHYMHQLFGLPFPRLETLEILGAEGRTTIILDVIRALRLACVGCDPNRPYLPSLRSLTLGRRVGEDFFRLLLALLQEWRIGETSSFHIKVSSWRAFTKLDHASQLREELVSVVGNRQIGMTWGRQKLC